MKKTFLAGLILVVLGTAVFYGVGASLPAEIRVSREVEIDGSPGDIFPFVSDLERWPEWTRWNAADRPGLELTYPGPTKGVGAVQTWTIDGDGGRLELTSAEERHGVSYRMTVGEGGAAGDGIISLAPATGGVPRTTVTWLHEGALEGTLGRWIGLFLVPAMERDFEAALAALKATIEGDS